MKSLIKPFMALLLVCLYFSAHAEKNENPAIITGTIIEKTTNQPVPFANVALVQKETGKIITGIMTDENGNFILNGLPYNSYELQVSYLGYKKRNIEIQVDENHNPLKVGKIELETDAQLLNEVTVSEERLKGKQEVDRTVYTINDDVKRLAKDGTDVLKHIPGVAVDFQENVTLEGTGNILYLVNGVPRDQQFVAQLNPEDFNKVEVITNPGVEYDADVDAVINIVLKKAPSGGRGGFNVMLGDPNKIASNHRANIDFGTEKFRVFISDRLNYQGYRAYSNKVTKVVNDGDIIDFSLHGDGDAVTIRNNTNYGLDLFLNDKNTLNLYGNTNAFLAKQSDFNEVGTQYVNGLMTDQYDMTTNLDNEGLGFYNSLFFKHKFEEKAHELTTQFDYYTFSGNAHNTFDYQYTFLDSTLETPIDINRFEDTRNHRQMLQSRNEYSKIIGKMRWKFGYWAYYQWLDNDFEGLTDNTKFKFNELRHEAFANGGGTLGKLNYNLGVRFAYSRSRIDQSATNTYNAFLPQISLMYGIKKGHSIKFSARRRIVRPTMNQLNPFEVRMDSSSIQMGNPNLDPQIINRLELQYGLNINKNYLGPKLFFEYTNNGMESLMTIDDEGKTVTKPENIGERYEYGLSVNGALKLFPWMRLNANARVYNTTVSGPNYKDDLWTAGANGNLVFTPWRDRKINFSTVLQYSTARLGYKSIHTRDILFLLTGDVTIKNNLRITGMFNPIGELFKYAGTKITDTDYYFMQEGHIDLNYVIMIGVSYNFKWGKTPKKVERSTDYEGDDGGGVL